jgi:hypothetical protein
MAIDRLTTIDRLAHMLRQKLSERARTTKNSATHNHGAAHQIDRIEAVNPKDVYDERQMRQVFIQQILTEQLGSDLVNDAQFQQIAYQVAQAIESEAETRELLDRLIEQIPR